MYDDIWQLKIPMRHDKQNIGAFENGLFEDDHIACLFE
jgi:hypothetical protein